MKLTGGSSWVCASDADLYWLPVCAGPANWKPHHETPATEQPAEFTFKLVQNRRIITVSYMYALL